MIHLIKKYFDCNNQIDRTPLCFPFDVSQEHWNLDIKPVAGDIQHVVFQDFLCFDNNRCIELEKYAQDKGSDRRIFYVPHYGLAQAYPELNVVYYNDVLYKNSLQFYMRRKNWTDDNLGSGNDILCLMRHEKPHRDLVYDIVKNLQINYSYQKLGKEPKYPGQSFDKYNRVFDNVRNFMSLKSNYVNANKSIVVESTYLDIFPFITEKTLQAFLSKHSVIPIASKHMLDGLQHLGFDMSYLNFNYDQFDHNVRYKIGILENRSCGATIKQKQHNFDVALNLHSIILGLVEKQITDKLHY